MNIRKTTVMTCAALGALGLLFGSGAASAAAKSLKGHALAQQSRFFGQRGPMVQAIQSTGLEMQIENPHLNVSHDRRVKILDRQHEYAYYNSSVFGEPVGGVLEVNGSPAVPLVFVDAPESEPDFFEGWILAQDLNIWGNSGSITMWDGNGREVEFSLIGVF